MKKITTIFVALAAAFLLTGVALADSYKLELTVTNFSGRGTLTNFPMLVKLDAANTDSYAGFLDTSNGYDLRFATNSALEGSALNYEIEEFDSAGTSYIWVQVPELSHSGSIWVAWGEDASQQASTTNGATWNSGFKGVYHMGESDALVEDWTANGYDATSKNGTPTNAPSGLIGGAVDFDDGGGDRINVVDVADFDVLDKFTASVWIYNHANGGWEGIMGTFNGGFIMALENSNDFRYYSNASNWEASGAIVPVNTWTHLAVVYNENVPANGTDGQLFMNGVPVGTAKDLRDQTSTVLRIGDGGNWGNRFDGLIDEVRIERASRSTNWIWASYMSQGDSHDAFLEYGSVEAPMWNQTTTTNITGTSGWAAGTALENMTIAALVWDTSDQGTGSTNDWTFSTGLGAPSAGDVSAQMTSLANGTDYVWRFYGETASTNGWSDPVSFPTLGTPVVTVSGGATEITSGSATLNGELTAGGTASGYIVWGDTVPAPADDTGTWQNVVSAGVVSNAIVFSTGISGLDPVSTYHYRCYVTNDFGEAWSSLTNFVTDVQPLVASLSPVNSGTDVQPDADLVATFNKDIALSGSGVIIVSNLTDATETSITLPDSQVSASGTDLTIDLSAPLEVGDTYAVFIDNVAVEDLAGTAFVGVTNDSTWSFTATTDRNWGLVAYWPLTNDTIGAISNGDDVNDWIGFDEVIDSSAHPATNATSSGSGASWSNDVDRGIVLYTPDNHRLTAGSGDSLGITHTEPFTWAFWVKVEEGSQMMGGSSNGRLRFRANGVDGGLATINGAYDVNGLGWVHMVLRSNGSRAQVLTNGVVVGTDTSLGDPGSSQLQLGGKSQYSEDIGGFITDIGIWKEELSDARIQTLVDGREVLFEDVAPTIASLSPTNNTPDVASTDDLILSFTEPVFTNAGSLTITNLTTPANTVVIPFGDPQITLVGSVMTVNVSSPFSLGDTYAVMIPASVIEDNSINYFAGITDTTSWRFTVAATDTVDPMLASLSPTNAQIQVPLGQDLVATFDEDIAAGTGNVILSNLTDSSETVIPIGDAQIDITGAALTIDPSSDLTFGKVYAVFMASGVIEDLAGNPFAGFTNATQWQFTADSIPSINSYTPVDDSTGVSPDTDITFVFDEAVTLLPGGVIIVTNLTDGSALTYTLPDSDVTTNSTTVVINPANSLSVGCEYAVQIDGSSFEDVTGNNFPGISDVTTWSFTTTVDPNWALVAYWPLTNDTTGAISNGDDVNDWIGLDEVIDSSDHPATNATSSGSGAAWSNDVERGTVLYTPDNHRLTAGSGDSLGVEPTEPFTWAFWVKVEDGSQMMGGSSNGRLRFMKSSMDGGFASMSGWSVQGLGWVHMVLRSDGSRAQVLTNGVVVATDTSLGDPGASQLQIGGKSQYSEDMGGFLNEVAIWKEELSDARIQALVAGRDIQLEIVAPAIASLSPTNNTPDVASTDDLILSFSEVVFTNAGSVTITNLTTPANTIVIPLGDPQITLVETVMTINVSTPFDGGDTYAVLIPADVIEDNSENKFAGITDTTTWRFTVNATDSVAPSIASLSPTNGTIQVPLGQNLVASFDEDIAAGSGNVVLSNLTDSSETVIPIGDAQINISGAALTIDPSSDLSFGKVYAVFMASGVVEDLAGNPFAGFTNATQWQFTADAIPSISSYTPVDDTTEVTPTTDLTFVFDEDVTLLPSGEITLTNLTDGSATTYTLPTSEVTTNSNTVTVSPASSLSVDSEYAVLIDAVSFEDVSGNNFPGISDATTWSFTTTTNANWSLVAYWPLTNDTTGAISNGDDVNDWVGLDELIDSSDHPATNATSSGSGAAWSNDVDRGIVLYTPDNHRLTAGSGDSLGVEPTEPFTWAFWVKVEEGSQMMGGSSNGRLRFMKSSMDGGFATMSGWSVQGLGWVHMVLRSDGSRAQVLTNGVVVATDTSLGDPGASQLQIGGKSQYSEDMGGFMNEVAIWQEELSDARIQALAAGATVLIDQSPPVLMAVSPTNGTVDVPVGNNLVASFDENVFTNAGDVIITNLTDGGAAIVITVPGVDADGVITASETNLTINPTANLAPSAVHAVLLGPGSVANGDGYAITGYMSTATWQFTTDAPDLTGPVVSALNPLNGATAVPVHSNLVVSFDENVALVNGGTITLTNLSTGGSTDLTVPSAQLSVLNTDLTIDPPASLSFGDTYAVLIESNAVEDSSGNDFLGITSAATWQFVADTRPVVTVLSPVDGATSVDTGSDLVMTFNRDVVLQSGGVVTVSNLTEATGETMTLPDSRVTVVGGQVTIGPASHFQPRDEYAVLVSASAIEDEFGQGYLGITGTVTWNFTPDTDLNANLVAWWPLTNDTTGAIANGDDVNDWVGLDEIIDSSDHPATNATSSGTGAAWSNDVERGIVLYTPDNHRLIGGGQHGIEPNAAFTWAFWVKVEAGSQMMGSDHNSKIRFRNNGLDGNFANISGYNVTGAGWTHMALRSTGSRAEVYTNGVFVGQDTSLNAISSGQLQIGGKSQYSEDIQGFMTDVAIWTEALSVDRIQQLAAGGDVYVYTASVYILK